MWQSVFICDNHCYIHGKTICKDVTLHYFGCNMSFCGDTNIVAVVVVIYCFSKLFCSMQTTSLVLSHIQNWVEKVVSCRFGSVLTVLLPPSQHQDEIQKFFHNCLIGSTKKVQLRSFARFGNLLFLAN